MLFFLLYIIYFLFFLFVFSSISEMYCSNSFVLYIYNGGIYYLEFLNIWII